jgi:predicted nucleic acid-binding protein
MSVLVDTSAFYAILDADDGNHERAKHLWSQLVTQRVPLFCNNYILVETFALVQHRLGIEAVRTLQEDILPIVTIHWVDESAHRAGMAGLLTAARRHLSLVDCVTFTLMRELGIRTAFTFDPHFRAQGFCCIP